MKGGIRMNPEFDIVDLGTKHGWAMDECRRIGNMYLKNKDLFDKLQPRRCVGYERPQAEGYRSIVENKNYNFCIADLATDEAIAALPKAEIYLAWHFLEHVPNKEWARKLVWEALKNAKHLVWFRLPSFQQDTENGEGVLRQHGMRFTWTFWRGHPTHWLVEDCTEAIATWAKEISNREYDLFVRPSSFVHNMANSRIVPIDAPEDTQKYDPKHGPKPLDVKFKQPIVEEWEIVVRFK
jgi:hypothetical protein